MPQAVKAKVLMRRYRFAARPLQGGSQSEKAQSSSEPCTIIIVDSVCKVSTFDQKSLNRRSIVVGGAESGSWKGVNEAVLIRGTHAAGVS